MPPFSLPITVSPADIDGLGHVNNVVYLRWMQEAATAHWESAASPELRAAVSWVVSRHEIDYKAPAFLGDRLVARTWVGEVRGATWERFIESAGPRATSSSPGAGACTPRSTGPAGGPAGWTPPSSRSSTPPLAGRRSSGT